MTLICDMEGDALLYGIQNVWCIVVYDIENDIWNASVPDEWIKQIKEESNWLILTHEEMLQALEPHRIVFHNAFGFDIPAFKKLYPNFNPTNIEDTFILSSLFNPDRSGGHSVESYGKECWIEKPKHEDWAQFSPEMFHRCIEDVRITTHIWNKMEKERHSHDWEESIQIEYDIAKENAQQGENGVMFDKEKALELHRQIQEEIKTIDDEVLPQIPKRCTSMEGVAGYKVKGFNTVYKRKADVINMGYDPKYIETVYNHIKKPFKKDGTLTKRVEEFIIDDK